MNSAALRKEDSASAPVLYMALELGNKVWKLAFSGNGKRRQVSVPAEDLTRLSEVVAKAKERFGMPASACVVSCYEAGRDGLWLHRHLMSIGIGNEVIDRKLGLALENVRDVRPLVVVEPERTFGDFAHHELLAACRTLPVFSA